MRFWGSPQPHHFDGAPAPAVIPPAPARCPVERLVEPPARGALHHRRAEPRDPAQRLLAGQRDLGRRRPRAACRSRAARPAGRARRACPRSAAPRRSARRSLASVQRKSARTPVPRSVSSTLVHWRLAVDLAHVLDPDRARPPAGQAVRVRDQVPDARRTGPRSAGCARRAASAGSYSAADFSRRRSRTRSRCLRWPQTAARLSRFSTASLRRAWLRERSCAPRSCSSSAASRSAEVRKTRRLRPATPNRDSSAAARTISRSVSS